MRHIMQPVGSQTCGQTVVAMATGKAVSTIVKVIGHDQATNLEELVEALRVFGIKTKRDGRKRWNKAIGNSPPKYAILKKLLHNKGEKYHGHWLLIWNGILHDPGMSKAGIDSGRGRITSYIELIPKKRIKK